MVDDPIVIENFLSENEVIELKDIVGRDKDLFWTAIENSMNVLTIKELNSERYKLINDLYLRCQDIVGHNFILGNTIIILHITKPIRVHCDTGWKDPKNMYKRFSIPIGLDTNRAPPGIVFFNQRHFESQLLFCKGTSLKDSRALYDDIWHDSYFYNEKYDFLENFNDDKPFDKEIYEKHLSYLDYNNLDGLTVDRIIEQKSRQAILFEAQQLHATSNKTIHKYRYELVIDFMYSDKK